MKKIAVLFLCISCLCAGAQNIKLNTGSKITCNIKAVMDMDMGDQMKMVAGSTTVLNITGVNDKNYSGTNTVTKILISQQGGGEDFKFDSDKKEDLESEEGKTLLKVINKPAAITIDKATGNVEELNPEKPVQQIEKNPMNDFISGMMPQNTAELAKTAFFIIPAGKKTGDKWGDSATTAGLKNTNDFELKSISDGIAVINIKTITAGTISKETQGKQMESIINSNTASVIEVDMNTFLVKKRTSVTEMTGTLEVMGQSLPVSAKVNTTTVFE